MILLILLNPEINRRFLVSYTSDTVGRASLRAKVEELVAYFFPFFPQSSEDRRSVLHLLARDASLHIYQYVFQQAYLHGDRAYSHDSFYGFLSGVELHQDMAHLSENV